MDWFNCSLTQAEKNGLVHPVGSSVNSDCFEHISQFWLHFAMLVCAKIYFEIYIYTNDQYS